MNEMITIAEASADAMSEMQIDPTLDLEAEIQRLKKEKNAIILAHYYQDGEIQDLADFVGDSLDLSRKAAETDADVIVFCGVRFMAEVAKILSPNKTVLLPDSKAGCSLEDSCQPEPFRKFREQHPDEEHPLIVRRPRACRMPGYAEAGPDEGCCWLGFKSLAAGG